MVWFISFKKGQIFLPFLTTWLKFEFFFAFVCSLPPSSFSARFSAKDDTNDADLVAKCYSTTRIASHCCERQ